MQSFKDGQRAILREAAVIDHEGVKGIVRLEHTCLAKEGATAGCRHVERLGEGDDTVRVVRKRPQEPRRLHRRFNRVADEQAVTASNIGSESDPDARVQHFACRHNARSQVGIGVGTVGDQDILVPEHRHLGFCVVDTVRHDGAAFRQEIVIIVSRQIVLRLGEQFFDPGHFTQIFIHMRLYRQAEFQHFIAEPTHQFVAARGRETRRQDGEYIAVSISFRRLQEALRLAH